MRNHFQSKLFIITSCKKAAREVPPLSELMRLSRGDKNMIDGYPRPDCGAAEES